MHIGCDLPALSAAAPGSWIERSFTRERTSAPEGAAADDQRGTH